MKYKYCCLYFTLTISMYFVLYFVAGRDAAKLKQWQEDANQQGILYTRLYFTIYLNFCFLLYFLAGRDAAKLKQWQEEKNQQEMVSSWRKEKEEARVARERVKEQIARDR